MGASCSSAATAPEVIIPDPGYDEEVSFAMKQVKGSKHAMDIFQGSKPNLESDRWLYLVKQQSYVASRSHRNSHRANNDVELHNYNGDVLYAGRPADTGALFEQTEPRRRYSVEPLVNSFMNHSFFRGSSSFEMNEDDSMYFDMAKSRREYVSTGSERLVRWKVETEVRIDVGTRTKNSICGDAPMRLRVFSTGAAVAGRYYHDVKKGQKTTRKTESRFMQFVDFVDFGLETIDGEAVAEWRFPGDCHSWSGRVFDTDVFRVIFRADTKAGVDRQVLTKEGYDPTLALILAYFTCDVFHPSGIRKKYRARVMEYERTNDTLRHEVTAAAEEEEGYLRDSEDPAALEEYASSGKIDLRDLRSRGRLPEEFKESRR